jgi:uracil-DNA glycosylase
MGFCYPGKGKSGDLPPRPECARTWHAKLLKQMPAIELTLLVGQYAQAWFLGAARKATLTDTVRAHREYADRHLVPLPHPSPRNVAWFKANPWFERDVLPALRKRIERLV